MDEYIEREAVLKKIESSSMWVRSFGELYEVVQDMPASDVAPVRHGRWDENGRRSNCGGHAPFLCMASTYYKSPWCQECGAKMDLED